MLDHADGKIVPSDNEFCRQALFSKEGFRRCNESVKVVRDRLRGSGMKRRSVVVHQCHLGFDVVAAPIQLDDAWSASCSPAAASTRSRAGRQSRTSCARCAS